MIDANYTEKQTSALIDRIDHAREQKNDGPLRSLLPFLRLLGPNRTLIILAVFFGLLNQVSTLVSAFVGAFLIGRVVEGATLSELQTGFIVLGFLIIPQTIAPWLETQLAHVAAFRVLADIRKRLYRAFARLTPGYLIDRRSGELGSTAVSDVEELENFFAHTLSPLLSAVIVPFGAMIGLGFIHLLLPVVMLPFLIALVWIPATIRKRAIPLGAVARNSLSELNSEAVDSTQGAREVIVFAAGKRQLSRLLEAAGRAHLAKVKNSNMGALETGVTDMLATAALLTMMILGGILVANGTIRPALLPALVVLSSFSFKPVTEITAVLKDIALVAASGRCIQALLLAPVPVVDYVQDRVTKPINPVVSYDHVSFRYSSNLPNAVSDVSFKISPGESVALVGHSGSGKTTLTHLLSRFWDVNDGSIKIGELDIREFPQSQLRELITVVPQDIYLFYGTVYENIAIANPKATRPELEEAARKALAHDFIMDMPQGYDTKVGERGIQLSGGQRQRIAIARALLKDSPILVLDEAVSSLDAESESAVQAAMHIAQQGRTTLIVAHRVSTICTADRVIMLDHGKIVAEGKHQDLLENNSRYAELLIGKHTENNS